MATQAELYSAVPGFGQTFALTRFIDRWIYVFMAVFLIAIVLVGFAPDSLQKIAAVDAGLRPPFPLALHAYALLMGCWMLLLLTQTTLMATGRRDWHKQLGVMGMVLAPAWSLPKLSWFRPICARSSNSASGPGPKCRRRSMVSCGS